MKVCSLELAKELFELSGWKGVNAFYASDSWIGFVRQEGYNPQVGMIETVTPDNCIPAYDLGYLLRKLPHGSYVAIRKDGATASTGNYNSGQNPFPYTVQSDTLEDAVCSLAILLIKEGVVNVEAS